MQKDQTGRKRQAKSDRAVGPQNDSEREKRRAKAGEQSCCRGENVIKYPSSWENAPAPAGVGNRLSRFCRRRPRTEFADTAAGAHPRVASFGLRPIHLQLPPYRVTLIRPSVRTGAPSPWKGEGWAGSPVCRPTAYTEAIPPFRRGRTPAGPQMYAARPGGRALQAPAATCSAELGAVVKS